MRRNQKGFTLVEIMIVVAIIALLAAIAIPNLLRARMAANDALAKSTLRTISTAAETYATGHSGDYPADITDLTGATPPYIHKNYCTYDSATETSAGFYYDCDGGALGGSMTTSSYIIVANPANTGISGTESFTISTGGVLTPP